MNKRPEENTSIWWLTVLFRCCQPLDPKKKPTISSNSQIQRKGHSPTSENRVGLWYYWHISVRELEIFRTVLNICSFFLWTNTRVDLNTMWRTPPLLTSCLHISFIRTTPAEPWKLTSVTSSPWTETSGLRKWHKATIAAMLAASIIFPSWFNKWRSTRICQTWKWI